MFPLLRDLGIPPTNIQPSTNIYFLELKSSFWDEPIPLRKPHRSYRFKKNIFLRLEAGWLHHHSPSFPYQFPSQQIIALITPSPLPKKNYLTLETLKIKMPWKQGDEPNLNLETLKMFQCGFFFQPPTVGRCLIWQQKKPKHPDVPRRSEACHFGVRNKMSLLIQARKVFVHSGANIYINTYIYIINMFVQVCVCVHLRFKSGNSKHIRNISENVYWTNRGGSSPDVTTVCTPNGSKRYKVSSGSGKLRRVGWEQALLHVPTLNITQGRLKTSSF